MIELDKFIQELPDAESAKRFLDQFGEKHPAQTKKLRQNQNLLTDVLTLVCYSPLLATTVLQNPQYLSWLNQKRSDSKLRSKEELLESLARFSSINAQIEPNVLLARFRRRELLRIFLRDIRRLATVGEITEEISNLADAILEYVLRLARQQIDNRYGIPLETDEKGRARPARFCIVSLGKLGSKELNYSSDIDLLFIYSAEGATSGQGARGAVTNREYFVKLAEFITKTVGGTSGEGAAYRVDLRLRPHGRIGALAMSLRDTARYYQTEARGWERQVLIRSRASAGEAEVFKRFFAEVEEFVFSKTVSVEEVLKSVWLSKEKINFEQKLNKEFNVKLGRGGIREIEFIAQALQLAYGGRDEWLRSSHTLITLTRLADRKLLTENELTELFEAYEFLRRLEHTLQMEHGLQTHAVPFEQRKRALVAKKMNFADLNSFDAALNLQTKNVNRIFARVFGKNFSEVQRGEKNGDQIENSEKIAASAAHKRSDPLVYQPILSSLEKSDASEHLSDSARETLSKLSEVSPHFAEMLAANPKLISALPTPDETLAPKNYGALLLTAADEPDLTRRLAALRRTWSRSLLEIVVFDVFERLPLEEVKKLQTELAEAALAAALSITRKELSRKLSVEISDFPFAVLGLGKLGSRGIDYGSDLDLVLIYDDEKPLAKENVSHAEFYGQAVEILVTALSALTREGYLYRVDLRLRPDGKNGATSIGQNAFLSYMETRAAIWEWLAYVKIRAVAGDRELARFVEIETRRSIHQNAQKHLRTDNFQLLKDESWRIREKLAEEKTALRRGQEIDIKFGAGGMLDIYFAVRFLQLRDGVPDDAENRSTAFALEKLYEHRSLGAENFKSLIDGYHFIGALDHQMRLTVGRSTRLPLANQKALQIIARRMKLDSTAALLEKLTFHRFNIRAAFEAILAK